jgi:hypothetical protein
VLWYFRIIDEDWPFSRFFAVSAWVFERIGGETCLAKEDLIGHW